MDRKYKITHNKGGKAYYDLTGERFGKLLVLGKSKEKLPQSKGENAWICDCDCGKKGFLVSTGMLTQNKKQSCGCLRRSALANYKRPKGQNSPTWRGYGEIPGAVWTTIHYNAFIRDINFEITVEEAWELFLKQGKRCALSGMSIGFAPAGRKYKNDRTASLDRIDSSKGYTLDNVQWVHKDLNIAKQDYTQERFIELCQKVANHQNDSGVDNLDLKKIAGLLTTY